MTTTRSLLKPGVCKKIIAQKAPNADNELKYKLCVLMDHHHHQRIMKDYFEYWNRFFVDQIIILSYPCNRFFVHHVVVVVDSRTKWTRRCND